MEKAEAAVAELLELHSNYFGHHGLDAAADRASLVAGKRDAAVAALDALLANDKSNARMLLLKGLALNTQDAFSADAEACLSRAIKLDGSLAQGWVALGECFWKKGDLAAAETCFTGMPDFEKNKDGLRNMSMVLRKKGPTHIEQSVELAKKAVALDVKDGHSWYILGNAYMALFFAKMGVVAHLLSALKAYSRAEADAKEAKNNPDLYFNRSMLLNYQEEYASALEGYRMAAAIDPAWDDPRTQISKTMATLAAMSEYVAKKGRMKPKRIAAIVAKLAQQKNAKEGTLAALKQGDVSEGKHALLVITGLVPTDNTPQVFVGCDAEGNACCLTVYNLGAGVIKEEDTVRVHNPYLRKVSVAAPGSAAAAAAGQSISFLNIRIDNPLQVEVNGAALEGGKLALAQYSSTTQG